MGGQRFGLILYTVHSVCTVPVHQSVLILSELHYARHKDSVGRMVLYCQQWVHLSTFANFQRGVKMSLQSKFKVHYPTKQSIDTRTIRVVVFRITRSSEIIFYDNSIYGMMSAYSIP